MWTSICLHIENHALNKMPWIYNRMHLESSELTRDLAHSDRFIISSVPFCKHMSSWISFIGQGKDISIYIFVFVFFLVFANNYSGEHLALYLLVSHCIYRRAFAPSSLCGITASLMRFAVVAPRSSITALWLRYLRWSNRVALPRA